MMPSNRPKMSCVKLMRTCESAPSCERAANDWRHLYGLMGEAISFKTALRAVLNDALPEEGCKPWFDRYDTAKGLAQAWFEGPQEQEKVKSELAKYGLTAEAIVAQTYVLRRDELDSSHRLLAAAEARRDAIIRNFNDYRAMSSLQQKPVVEAEQVALVPNSA